MTFDEDVIDDIKLRAFGLKSSFGYVAGSTVLATPLYIRYLTYRRTNINE